MYGLNPMPDSGIAAEITYGIEAAASGASAPLPALRAQTPMRYVAPGTVGVHTVLAVVDQSRNVVHVAQLSIVNRNLYDTGAVPPVGVAAIVIAVPIGCGRPRSGVSVTAETGVTGGGGGGEGAVVIVYGSEAAASGALALLPALRAQTPMAYVAPASVGVHTTLAVVDQSCSVVHVAQLLVVNRNLYETGAVPPVGIAVIVIAVPVG
jgi:hypothetical protein